MVKAIICKTCKTAKKASLFYSCNLSHCKECLKERTRLWWKTPAGIQYDRNRRQLPEYKKYRKNYYRKWYYSNGRKRSKQQIDGIRQWRKDNPKKTRAMAILNQAVLDGVIIRPSVCTQCGRKARIQGHHDDYRKPLAVMWLCASCHKLHHLSP